MKGSLLSSQHRSVVYMVYGMLAVLGTLGSTYLMIILSHCLVLYTISLAKQKWLCFIVGLCSLASFKVEPFSTWQVRHMQTSLSPPHGNLPL